jgi:hypothetical protein
MNTSATYSVGSCYIITTLCQTGRLPIDVCSQANISGTFYGKVQCAPSLIVLNVYNDSSCSVPFTVPSFPIPQNSCLVSSAPTGGSFQLNCSSQIVGTFETATAVVSSATATASATGAPIKNNGALGSTQGLFATAALAIVLTAFI